MLGISHQTQIWIIVLAPMIGVTLGSIALFMSGGVWKAHWVARWMGYLTVVISFAILVLSIELILNPPDDAIQRHFSPLILEFDLFVDSLSIYFILIVNIVAFVASWNAVGYLEENNPPGRRQSAVFFHTLVNLFHFTMLVVPVVDNLVVLWMAIEATTLVSTLLVSFNPDPQKRDPWEAAWKYLIVTSTGIVFALLGTMFLATSAKSLIDVAEQQGHPNNIMNWTFLMKHANELTPDFVQLSFLFILIGYGTKAGFAPMHTWLPDGHGEAPAPISALLSGVLLKSALYAILRFNTITNATLADEGSFSSGLLLALGLLSLLVSTPFIISKNNRFKRVLAYHSLEHMGIITFGLGIGGPIAVFGALLHVLNHAITKALMFLSFGNVMRRYQMDQNEIDGILGRMPKTGYTLVIGGLALVGTPPFNIFMSEFIILWGAFKRLENNINQADWLSSILVGGAIALFVLSTTLIFYGLIRHLAKLVLQSSTVQKRLPEPFWADLFPLTILLIPVLITGLWVVPPLSDLLSESVNITLIAGNGP